MLVGNLTHLRGTGRDLVQEAVNLDELANPEFYATRRHSSALFNQLLDSVNPNGLTLLSLLRLNVVLHALENFPDHNLETCTGFGNAFEC